MFYNVWRPNLYIDDEYMEEGKPYQKDRYI